VPRRINPEDNPRPGKNARRVDPEVDSPLADPRKEYTADEHAFALEVKGCYALAVRDYLSRLNGRKVHYTPARRYDGCEASRVEGRRAYPSVWLKVARYFRETGADPAVYVRRALSSFRASGAPSPDQLLTPAAMRAYEEAGAAEEAGVRTALTTQATIVQVEIQVRMAEAGARREAVWRRVLFDERLAVSPLFRYAVAASQPGGGLAGVAAHYRRPAADQYRLAPDLYDRFWGDFLPADFRRDARAAAKGGT
jgi:hypothetical protein